MGSISFLLTPSKISSGIYQQTADEQCYPYIRPQETGTKSDLRRWTQSDATGHGIQVMAEKAFSASALHYSVEALDDGDKKEQRHIQLIQKSPFTNLYINGEMAGVGGIDSWSSHAEALDQYRVHYTPKMLRFSLMPR